MLQASGTRLQDSLDKDGHKQVEKPFGDSPVDHAVQQDDQGPIHLIEGQLQRFTIMCNAAQGHATKMFNTDMYMEVNSSRWVPIIIHATNTCQRGTAVGTEKPRAIKEGASTTGNATADIIPPQWLPSGRLPATLAKDLWDMDTNITAIDHMKCT